MAQGPKQMTQESTRPQRSGTKRPKPEGPKIRYIIEGARLPWVNEAKLKGTREIEFDPEQARREIDLAKRRVRG